MATNYPVPPTFADPIIEDRATKKPIFNPIWLEWFSALAKLLGNSGAVGGSISHEALGNLLGGDGTGHYHLTTTAYNAVTGAPTALVTTPAVGVSPATLTNSTGYRVLVVITGGTLTDVSFTRDNATFYSAGTSRVLMLSLTDSVRITYAAAPTVAFIPI